MRNAHLRLVTDNTACLPRAAGRDETLALAKADYAAFAMRARYWLALVLMILGAPFRFVAAIGRVCFATGVGFFNAIFRLVLGTIGLALILCVGYGMLRVVCYPLFH